MKKNIAIIMALIVPIMFTGCGRTEEEKLSTEIGVLKDQITTLKSEISVLEMQKEELANEVLDTKIENGAAKYVVTFNIKQSHFTLDISQHLKDSMNDISIQVPVDKEYYDSIEIGDTIDDSFRMGSLIFCGSFGSWDITVENKEIR